MDTIRVVCRFRPQSEKEIQQGGQICVDLSNDLSTVQCQNSQYSFDRIYDWTTTQDHIFQDSCSAIVDDILKGYNGTLFAYGQTGSGKTYTMMGDMDQPELKGLTPRIVERLFKQILDSSSNLEFTVKCSYMEIYMEKVKDLLNPSQDNLPVHEDKTRGVYVKGLLEVFVSSVDEVYQVMQRGLASRVVRDTQMNAESSRSHSIFVLQVSQKNLQDGSVKMGKLYLVDLAGSEKVGKTGATGQTLEEAKKINKSLSALGMVINALTDGKSSHVPYRDSKLTRILQESLGGNAKTTLIINCSPSTQNDQETISTLRFGVRAKSIKNKAKINAELSPNELKALLKKAKSEIVLLEADIEQLNGELKLWRSGQTVPQHQWYNHSHETPLAPSLVEIAVPSTEQTSIDEERAEFLERENELVDQLAEREKDLQRQQSIVKELSEELEELKKRDADLLAQNMSLHAKLNETSLSLEKALLAKYEMVITMDSLKDSRVDLERQIEMIRTELEHVQTLKVKVEEDDQKHRKKEEKMMLMMAEFDPSVNLIHLGNHGR